MNRSANYRAAIDAGIAFLLHTERHRPGASERGPLGRKCHLMSIL